MLLRTNKSGTATNWLVRSVILGVILIMAANVFGIGQVWDVLWKAVVAVILLSLSALGYCLWQETKTSLHQRYD